MKTYYPLCDIYLFPSGVVRLTRKVVRSRERFACSAVIGYLARGPKIEAHIFQEHSGPMTTAPQASSFNNPGNNATRKQHARNTQTTHENGTRTHTHTHTNDVYMQP